MCAYIYAYIPTHIDMYVYTLLEVQVLISSTFFSIYDMVCVYGVFAHTCFYPPAKQICRASKQK